MQSKKEVRDQNYDLFLVLDFEATCIKDMRINPQEIIEFPCVVINAKTFKEEGRFHQYVKPVYKPQLSPYCIKFTGIKQESVDKAKKFPEVLSDFVQFSREKELGGKKAIFVTCGDWDLGSMLPSQCNLSKIDQPDFTKRWINLKTEFTRIEETQISRAENDMEQMLRHFRLEAEGRLHSGVADVGNIVKILRELCCKDVLLESQHENCLRVDGYGLPEIVWEKEKRKEEGGGEDERRIIVPGHVKEKLTQKPKPQTYDYILVLDFEATCLKDMAISPQEIIEFPCLIMEAKNNFVIKDIFHHYVRPLHKPKLSPFCTKLTKITQRMVDESKTFPEVFRLFKEWIENEVEEDKTKKFIIATCGDWDLNTMLPSQLETSKIRSEEVPEYSRRWINVKTVFEKETEIVLDRERNDLTQMIEVLGLVSKGHLHSGIDDIKNIGRVLEALSRFTVLEQTSR